MPRIESLATTQPQAYGLDALALQSYAPVMPRREFDADEVLAIERGRSRLIGKIMPGYDTPLAETLASPGKQAVAAAIAGLVLGTGLSAHLLGGVMVGGGLAAFAYFHRRHENENTIGIMHHLPKGATRRDLMSDPAVQSQLNRQALAVAAQRR